VQEEEEEKEGAGKRAEGGRDRKMK